MCKSKGGGEITLKIIGFIADKLLGVVVPGIEASACCSAAGQSITEFCECSGNGVGLYKRCVFGCQCVLTCSACNITSSHAGCRG